VSLAVCVCVVLVSNTDEMLLLINCFKVTSLKANDATDVTVDFSLCMCVVCHTHAPCTMLKPLDGMRCHLAGTLVCPK